MNSIPGLFFFLFLSTVKYVTIWLLFSPDFNEFYRYDYKKYIVSDNY